MLDALSQVDQAIRLARIDTLQQGSAGGRTSRRLAEGADILIWQFLTSIKMFSSPIAEKNASLSRFGSTKRIQFFLTQPEALESDNQLKNAVLLLNEAGEIGLKGPRLTTRHSTNWKPLSKLAKTPVTITIESDNLTEVAVYRVGKLGKFSVHDLKLRPGSYTVVGARDGYKDVRQEIVVKPGQESLRITVKCRIKI